MGKSSEGFIGEPSLWRSAGADRPEAALKRVVARALAAIGACEAAGVTLVRNGRTMSVVSTADIARELDAAQCRADEGPSLDAIRQLQVFNVGEASHAASWPRFREAAAARGIRSSLSVPLTAGGEAFGALNLYSSIPDAFAGCEADAVVFAAQAAQAAAALSGALPGPGESSTGHREGRQPHLVLVEERRGSDSPENRAGHV